VLGVLLTVVFSCLFCFLILAGLEESECECEELTSVCTQDGELIVITLETFTLDTPNNVAVFVTDALAKWAPMICPLSKSEKSPIF
jgi:hypothetical protein